MAASARFDIEPTRVFETAASGRAQRGAGAARLLAGAALAQAGFGYRAAVARALDIDESKFAPSQLKQRNIAPDMVAGVVVALERAFPEAPLQPLVEARPKTDPLEVQRLYLAGYSLRAVGERLGVSHERVAQILSDLGVPRRPKRGRHRRAPAAPAVAAAPAPIFEPRRAPQPAQAARKGGAVRLKPVSAAVVRYARWFVAARWQTDTVASLFDVDPIALRRALRAEGTLAA